MDARKISFQIKANTENKRKALDGICMAVEEFNNTDIIIEMVRPEIERVASQAEEQASPFDPDKGTLQLLEALHGRILGCIQNHKMAPDFFRQDLTLYNNLLETYCALITKENG